MKRALFALVFLLVSCEPSRVLPFSRSQTATAASDVDSDLTNEIQDSIAARHNKPLHLSAHSFHGAGKNTQHGSSTISLNDVDFPNESYVAYADLTPHLIPGDTIKEITWRYYNGATPDAGNVALQLQREDAATGATTMISNTAANATTGGADAARNELVAAINHVVLANTFYRLTFTCDAAPADDGCALRGATVTLGQ